MVLKANELRKVDEKITLDEVISYLNKLLQLDKSAINKLCVERIVCNKKFANHPTCKVINLNGTYYVGLLGVINGIFGNNNKGRGKITAIYDENGCIEKFCRTL